MQEISKWQQHLRCNGSRCRRSFAHNSQLMNLLGHVKPIFFADAMALMGLALCCLRVAFASSTSLPIIPYLELQAQPETVLNAFATDGILLVPGVPGFADARRAALHAMSTCFAQSTAPAQFKDRLLADGAQRRTAAAETHGHTLRPMQVGCPEFEQKADVLRTMVHMTLMEVIRVWGLAGNHDNKVVFRHESGNPYMSLLDAVSSATHLEHFHMYTSRDGLDDSDGRASLDLHTDAGLLLAFASPLYSSTPSTAPKATPSGLVIQRETLKAIDLPEDSIAFLVGEAAKWLPWPARPLPHELHLPSGQRAWYGIMSRLPEDAVKTTDFDPALAKQRTFGEWWHRAMTSLSSSTGIGCGVAEAAVADPTHLCPEGQAYCWMQCMMLPPACTLSTAKCVHPDGTPWSNHSEMCPTCTLTCPAFTGWDFCDESAASDMIMQGFVAYGITGSKTKPCVILFFQSWVLNTRWKFWLGTLGVFTLGALVELVATIAIHPTNTKLSRFLQAALYCFRMTLAYLVMLAAMTFCVEIFAAVVLGLGVGHAIFGHSRKSNLSGPSLCCSHGSDLRRRSRDIRVTPCLQADTCVVLRVHGMTCGSCTQTVARALEGVNGVASATVTLGSSGPTGGLQGPGLAEVWVNAGFPGVEAAVSAVEDAGFEAQSLPKSWQVCEAKVACGASHRFFF